MSIKETTERKRFLLRIKGIGWCAAILTLLSSPLSAQYEKDIQWVNELVIATRATNPEEQRTSTHFIINRLKPYEETHADARMLIEVLQTNLDLHELKMDALRKNIVRATDARTPEQRTAALEEARVQLFEDAAFFLERIDPRKLSPEQAIQISELLETGSKLLDEINDPSLLGAESSTISKVLSLGNALYNLRDSIEDRDARGIVSGLLGTLGAFDKNIRRLGVSMPNPIKAIQFPMAIAAGMLGVTKKGFTETTNAMHEVSLAISGDPQALERLKIHAEEIERTLSPKTYGKAMADAMIDSLLDKIPFVGTLKSWLWPDDESWLIGKWVSVENNLGQKLPDEVGLVIEFVREDNYTISGYIREPTPQSEKAQFSKGEKVFRGYVEGKSGKQILARGECLDSNHHFMFEKGAKRWIGWNIEYSPDEDFIHVSCNFTLLRFERN